MGTKIQCKTVLPAFYSVKDLNGSLSNGMCLPSHDEQTAKIGQHFDSFSLRLPMDGYFEYEKEKVRQTILKHESTFRHQLQELHRLYCKQRDMMNDLKMRELHKNHVEVGTLHSSLCLSHTPPDEVKRTWHANSFSLVDGQVSSSATHHTRSLFECRKAVNKADLFPIQGNEDKHCLKRNNYLADLNEPILIEDTICLEDDGVHKVKKFHESPFVERNDGTCLKHVQLVHGGDRPERLTFDINADVQADELPRGLPSSQAYEPPKKKTIFGVVISDSEREPFVSASSGNLNSLKQSIDFNGVKTHMNGVCHSFDLNARLGQGCPKVNVHQQNMACMQTRAYEESSKGPLPWFIAKSHHSLQHNNSKGKNSYHMNLDLLQSFSQQFFKKSELVDESFSRVLSQKEEDMKSTSTSASEQSKIGVGDAANVKKIFGVPIFNPSATTHQIEDMNSVIEKGLDSSSSGLRNEIDLNLSLEEEEEEVPPEPCLLQATEIDLEAPAIVEPEKNTSLEAEVCGTKLPQHEDVTREAAEAIVSISLSAANSVLDKDANPPLEAASSDHLTWFADLIVCHESLVKGEPDEDFEFMTLKLRDMNEEGKCYEPSILEIHYDDEEETEAPTLKRPRRGQARRGRQRRDFQRDVLPGLVSLARNEVSEDILTFEELLKTSGSSWQSRISQRKMAKNGRRRRRIGSSTPSLTKTAIFQPPINQQPICCETMVEKTSLTGWGKRTRRIPRQRCPNSNPTPQKPG